MFQCHSPISSHPRPLPQSPKDCSIHLCLFAVHCVSPLLASSVSFLSKYQDFQKVLILVPKHASLSLGNLILLHRFNYYLLSEKYIGAIPSLSLKYQTLTFNDL